MSKPKRNDKGQYTRSRSLPFLVSAWVLAGASLGLVWLSSRALISDLASFRSCDGGTGISTISSCGKQSMNIGDMILLGLFVLSACFSFSLLIGAWRMTRKGTVIV